MKKIKGLFWRADYYGASIEGGMTSMQIGLLNAIQKINHDAFFVSSGRVKLPDWVNYYFIPHNKLMRNLPEVLNLPYNTRVIRKLQPILKYESPDFIYQFHHDFIISGSLLKRETGLPFFLQCEGVQQWTKLNWGKLYFPKLLKDAEEIQWQNADHIFTVSEQVKKLMVEYGVEDKKITVNPSRVDTQVFHPNISGAEIRRKYDLEDKFVIAFTGTFAQWHGVEVLAESIKYIKSNIKNSIVLFIGDGILRPKIEEIIKRDNVEDFSIITGIVPFDEMPEYLAACDILVTPGVSNSDTEFFNSPIKLFEYLAMGKAIIASSVGQQNDVIQDGINGMLIPEKNPEAIADTVFRLFKERDLADRIALQARRDAVEKHNWQLNANKIIEAYNEVIKSR